MSSWKHRTCATEDQARKDLEVIRHQQKETGAYEGLWFYVDGCTIWCMKD